MAPPKKSAPKAQTEKQDTKSFRYGDFPIVREGDIRLLELLPGVGNAPISCSISRTNLSRNPLYTAVSYTWGREPPDSVIGLNGFPFSVRPNLESLLRGLRQPKQSRQLWIDAICINQNDNQERNVQVKQIGDIFSSANYVVAWMMGGFLGDFLEKKDHDAILSIRSVCDGKSSLHGAQWEQLHRFFDNHYWTRRWIVQELGLARKVTIEFGGDKLSMSSLALFFQIFQGGRSKFRDCLASRICTLREANGTLSNSLEDLLFTYKETECEDPRDKIFALVSLSLKAKVSLEVDYEIDPTALMLSVIRFCAEYENLAHKDIVGLGALLKSQLQLSLEDVELCLQRMSPAQQAVPDKGVLLFRGIVTSQQFDSDLEDLVEYCRNCLPSLVNYQHLYFDSMNDGAHITAPAQDKDDAHSEPLGRPQVSSYDFYDFGYSSKESPAQLLGIGLASIRVTPGDEILQFARTPLALILRKTSDGYAIVGRAFLLRPATRELTEDMRRSRQTRLNRLTTVERLVDFADDDDPSAEYRRQPFPVSFDTRAFLMLVRLAALD